MSRFVDVPRESFISTMERAGFTQLSPAAASELVFVRHSSREDLVVKIYSSIWADAGFAREAYARNDATKAIVGPTVSVRV